MADRSAPIVVTPHACPFVALEGDRDRRLDTPDALHRCFAEPIPRPRSVTHQAGFCLSSEFAACPIFLDWASRAAAEPVEPRIPTAATPLVQSSRPITDAPARTTATPPMPGTGAVPLGGAKVDALPPTGAVPVPRSAAVTPAWAAPPPWMRQATPLPWVAEAVPPPDIFTDIGTSERPATGQLDGSLPAIAVPVGPPQGNGVGLAYRDDTTDIPPALSQPPMTALEAATRAPVDPTASETAAELAASRYRTDLLAGAEPDDEEGAVDDPEGSDAEAPGSSRQRPRVPIDASASTSVGPQARPAARSTGSREWEGPRRFEAYAATQRRRPGALLVGGGALVLTAVIIVAFLVPGLFLGGAPASTATPGPSAPAAAALSTPAGARATAKPKPKPERTPRTYRVKSGDTLIKISRRFDVSVESLQCINRIRNPNNVVVGSALTIPTRAYRCPKATRKP